MPDRRARGCGAVKPAFSDLYESQVAGDHQRRGDEEETWQGLEAQGAGERGGRKQRADGDGAEGGLPPTA